MSYLSKMFELQEEYSVAASLLILDTEYYANKKTLHLFVEDDDDYDFYYSFAVRIYNDYEIQRYPQKGKDNLLAAFNKITWNKFNKSRILFFYDKDYDDLICLTRPTDINLFSTAHYSIENYLVMDEVYRIIISDFHTNASPALISEIINEIRLLYEVFISKLKIITSWILIYRKKGLTCELDEIKFDDFFYCNKGDFCILNYKTVSSYEKIVEDKAIHPKERKKYRSKKLKTILEEKTKADPLIFTFKELLANYRQIQQISDPKLYTRGKYEFWFIFKVFYPFLNEKLGVINNRANTHNAIVSNLVKMPLINSKVLIRENNIFGIIPGKMKIPSDIDFFLRNNHALA